MSKDESKDYNEWINQRFRDKPSPRAQTNNGEGRGDAGCPAGSV